MVPAKVPVTPAGKPETTFAPVAPLATVYSIGVMAVLIQSVCASVFTADVSDIVALGLTKIVPDSLSEPQPPTVAMV